MRSTAVLASPSGKSKISALAAERVSVKDVDAFVDDVIQTVDAFDLVINLPSTYRNWYSHVGHLPESVFSWRRLSSHLTTQ